MNLDNNIYRIPVGTKQDRGIIIPVFLPFAGCPFQCIYCVQDKQSGAGQISIADALKKLESDIEKYFKKTQRASECFEKIEIAFYGGTFTALNDGDLLLCLEAFKKIKVQLAALNIKVFGRCSTRPDCLGFEDSAPKALANKMRTNGKVNDKVNDKIKNEEEINSQKVSRTSLSHTSAPHNVSTSQNISTLQNASEFQNDVLPQRAVLLHLKNAGIDLIELGIQSFDDNALDNIGRGYRSGIAKKACQYIKDSGFELGIQLMPGIPKQSAETFQDDVEIALGYKPACLRYYPCLVPSGTGLAKLWQAGKFVPWDLQTCVDALGYALHRAWQEEVPVIRLSVAPERDFDENILAGVRHPALGSLIQARALLYSFDANKKSISENSYSSKCKELEFHVPRSFQGFVFGEKNSLKEAWETRVGVKNIFFDAEMLEKREKGAEASILESPKTKFAFLVREKNDF